jgi:hypothetical protein
MTSMLEILGVTFLVCLAISLICWIGWITGGSMIHEDKLKEMEKLQKDFKELEFQFFLHKSDHPFKENPLRNKIQCSKR